MDNVTTNRYTTCMQKKKTRQIKKPKNPVHELVDFYYECKDIANKPKLFYVKNDISYARSCRSMKKLLELCKHDEGLAMKIVYDASRLAKYLTCSWTAETIIKWKKQEKI